MSVNMTTTRRKRAFSTRMATDSGGTFTDESEHRARGPHVLLGVADPQLRADLSENLRRFGYDVTADDTGVVRLESEPDTEKSVVIQEIDPRRPQDIEYLAAQQSKRGHRVPIIAIMSDYDLALHLRAIAAGTTAIVSAPVDFVKVMDKLEGLSWVEEQEPFRVLIVDDSESMATFYANILRQAGMAVETVTNPLQSLDVLNSFGPDLILMDLYMPECSGFDLAGAIRQIDSYLAVPIVFLSSEDDIEKQVASMRHGADDFLTKDIASNHLVAAVTVRIQRARRLRQQMISDSLTGLLNHSAIKQRLQSEISRATRLGQALSFAMIDIDKFKSINDTHGHPVGDVVIKNLARLLRQRLRSADIVGRYGGEEFAIILPDTTAEKAKIVLDELRESFAAFEFSGATGSFSASFSGGVSSLPHRTDVTSLCDAADVALYQAKRSGRNCIVIDSAD